MFFLTQKGKEVIEYYINELISEGVSTIPRWQPPEGHKSKGIEIPSSEDTPSQDSGLRSRTNSSGSQHSRSSVSSLVLGASAATIKSPVSDGINILQLYNQLVLCLTILASKTISKWLSCVPLFYFKMNWSWQWSAKMIYITLQIYWDKRLKFYVHVKIYLLPRLCYVLKLFSLNK